MPEYCIQAAIFKLPIPFNFTHHFWILREIKTGQVISQLHGLATSRKSGKIVPIGYKREHSLRAYCIIYDRQFANQYGLSVGSYALPIHASQTIYEEEDCVQRWLKAIRAVKAINNLDLNYPRCGFKIPFSNTINSNSIYTTFAEVMCVPLYVFDGFFNIGIHASIYDKINNKF